MEHKNLAIEGFEQVVEFKDPTSKLYAIIAIHNTQLGPALGGTRAHQFTSVEEALAYILPTAQEMTYKTAVTQIGAGGGKAFIFKNQNGEITEAMLLAFAEAINHFQGKYICTKGLGIEMSHLEVISRATPYVAGLLPPQGSGELFSFTARGGYLGIQAVCQMLWSSPSVKGKTIAIQGLGNIGMRLARHLFWGGANLIVADNNESTATLAAQSFGAQIVSTEDIYKAECDIFSPCATSGVLTSETIAQLRCKAVAGLANCPFDTKEKGAAQLADRGILYAPDFVINAGGLINIGTELNEGTYSAQVARNKLQILEKMLMQIFEEAQTQNCSPELVAKKMAEYNLANGIGKRTQAVMLAH